MSLNVLHSELIEAHKLIPHLLQPGITKLSSDIIAVYIQASAKIFGRWAAETSQRWSEDVLPEVKALVQTIMDRLNDFVGSPDIEVQERVG